MTNTLGDDVATLLPGEAVGDVHAHGTALVLESLTKVFGGPNRKRSRNKTQESVRAVHSASLEVHAGEFFTLLGPSGCGKTTILRSIAGLETPDSGSIRVAERYLFDAERRINVPANLRGLGMVFQSYAIWPHMSVRRNVSLPLETAPRRVRISKAAIRDRVDNALAATQLDKLADRSANKMSGGQQQRLALARALALEPPVMLLDEPLSNLDAKLRETMRFELKRLQRSLGVTAIYVTHDQSEALGMSNRIAVMEAGHIIQVGRPREIYDSPATAFVAGFVGSANFIEGTVQSWNGTHCEVATENGVLVSSSAPRCEVGERVRLSLRPENLVLTALADDAPPEGSQPNTWEGTVRTRAFLGECIDHVVSVGEVELRARTNPARAVPAGAHVRISVDPDSVVIVPSE